MVKAWITLLAGFLAAAGTAGAASGDGRFSQGLSVAERTEIGINRLSTDQVAVLDALVRRDTAARSAPTAAPGAPASFSQRLTADERRNAGLTLLTPAELPRLDAIVERREAGGLARALLAPPVFLSPVARLTPAETRKGREIHGSFSLSYGMGKGGYSERSGGMVLTMDDPERRYSITVSYRETHIKSPNGYYDYGYRGGDLYRNDLDRGDRLREYPGGPDPFLRP
ncbi:MAG: hypothetical protein HY736_17795 [Verrucomicrobia bacterium]|nr:hypothetical protein [Verrucomicrobiota bacterium]